MLSLTGAQWGQLAQVIVAVVALVGVIPAVYLHFYERRKERLERVYQTYNEMGDKWSEFLRLCLDHPELGHTALGISGADEDPVDLYLYSLLIQLLNRAYVTYKDEPRDVREDRYRGWEVYMEALARDQKFRQVWKRLGNGYDTDFAREFDNMMPDEWRTLGRTGGTRA